MLPLLKKAGITVAFRGQNKKNPHAPGQLSDWYFIENVNSVVKRRIVKDVNASPKWRQGVSPRGEGAEGAGVTLSIQGNCTNL